MKDNRKTTITVVIKWIMFIFYLLLAYMPGSLLYKHLFCPWILGYMVPDEALLAILLACCWGIWSTVQIKQFNVNYWVKSIIITLVWIFLL